MVPSASDRNAAVFVLNWQGTDKMSRKKKLGFINYDSFVGEYDHLIFAMMASASIQQDTLPKNYLAEMLVQVLGRNIEMYLECLDRYEDFLNDPYATVQSIGETMYCGAEETDIFSKTEDDMNYAVWSAQIKTLYHLLEEYRGSFVSKYRDAIAKNLPIKTPWGEEYKEPDDVELGTLKALACSRRVVLTDNEWKRLLAFYEARNKLSHLKVLAFHEVCDLIRWSHGMARR